MTHQPTSIGAQIAAARLRYGWTQDQLAYEAGVTQGYISEIENDRKTPSIATARKLALALRMRLGDLINKAA